MSFLSTATSAIGQYSNTAKKSKRKQRRLQDTQSNVAKLRARANQAAFIEEGQQRRLALNDRLAARGMAGGTHSAEQKRLFESAYDRGLNDTGYDITLAEQSGDIASYAKKTRNRFNPLKIVDFVLESAEDAAGLGMFGGVGGGGGGGGTEGLEAAIW